ncbi:MAG: hypothetical protein U0172_12280 [Nitrospiraceae bacterium]
MPHANNFQHTEYSRADPGPRLATRDVTTEPPVDSAPWHDQMAAYGARLRESGVRLVVFLHGVPLGTDLFGAQRLDDVGGLKRGYSRGISGLDSLLSLLRDETNGLAGPPEWPTPPWQNDAATKQGLDETLRDACNFTDEYVATFQKAVNRGAAHPIRCERYLWSCESHHLGRAQAACLLLDQLRQWVKAYGLGAGDRILVQAHGHAALLMALITNLLDPAPLSGRPLLLQALQQHVTQTTAPSLSTDQLRALESSLEQGEGLFGARLDVVTLGAPVRYGWDLDGVDRLLHLINHRTLRLDGKRWLAKMELPQVTMEMPIAWGGDYVQQLATAGTDARPATPEAQALNKQLWELLEPWDGFERWLEIARRSVRCPNDGLCRLIDYKDCTGSTTARDHYFGHAAYTRLQAMLPNLTEIIDACYSAR